MKEANEKPIIICETTPEDIIEEEIQKVKGKGIRWGNKKKRVILKNHCKEKDID
jgi:hypothetical protein